MTRRSLPHDAYTVGWFCPLEVEQVAALEMLDEEHQLLWQPKADTNVYNLGSINNYNIVIAGLPRTGNCSAATVVAQMKMTFPNLRYGLLVGIGGGVPVETDHGPIRLGHVVVSEPTGIHSGVIQYDHGKARKGHFERKGFLAPPPTALLNAAREVAVQRQRMSQDPIWGNLQRIQANCRINHRFRRPAFANDHLYQPGYKHRQAGSPCQQAGCDKRQRIRRQKHSDERRHVVVHRGTIASGELVIKDAKKRSELAREHGVLCFEMEAAGILADFPCMVIRGISDYCDSHKNDVWHGYASAVAAAYARQLFFHMPIENEKRQVPFQKSARTLGDFELPFSRHGFSEVTHFLAREHELERMADVLQGGAGRSTVVVHGLGGIGKTQLAIAYAKQYRDDYSAVLWLNAKDETALKQSFAHAARWIQRHHPTVTYLASALEKRDLIHAVEAVKRWLEEPGNDRWLLVCDNYDNPPLSSGKEVAPCVTAARRIDSPGEEVEDLSKAFELGTFLPESDYGAIIVTTRSSMVKLGQVIHLGKLQDINDSIQILASTSNNGNLKQDPAAIELAKRLDGLPIALATAGAYLEQVSVSCGEYLELYEESWLELHEETPKLPAYDRTLYSTWNISYRYIEQKSTVAATILRQWAYFDNQDLWYEFLRGETNIKPQWLEELTRSKLGFHRAMRLLCSHGLVEADPPGASPRLESRGYSVHGCVHSWMTYVLNQGVNWQMAWLAIELIGAHAPELYQRDTWVIQRRLVAHADRNLEFLKAQGIRKETAWAFHLFGSLYLQQGKLKAAEEVFERALEGYEKVFGLEDKATVDVVNFLGCTYAELGRYEAAEAMFQRARKGYDTALGQEEERRCMVIQNLGHLYLDRGKLEAAEPMLKQALESKEKVWGPDHLSTLMSVNELGNLYSDQGKLEDAEEMLQRALQGSMKLLGWGSRTVFDMINSLGVVYKGQGKLEAAQAMCEQALQGFDKAWGTRHPSTLEAMTNLGHIYADQGRLKEAETMYKRTLTSYEDIPGLAPKTDTMLGLETLRGLGTVCAKFGNTGEALLYYKNARDGSATFYGRDSKKYRELCDEVEKLEIADWS